MPVRGGRTLVKLLDFGIAKLIVGDAASSSEALTSFAGTPQYASPEQAQGIAALDGKSDVYSFGVMAYEMFGGHLPFASPVVEDLLRAHISKAPPPLDLAWAGTPPDLEKLVLQLLYKKPELRPTLAEARERLIAIRDRSLQTPTLESIPAIRRPTPRKWVSAAAFAGLFAAMSMGAWARFRRSASADSLPAALAITAPVMPNAGAPVTLPLAPPVAIEVGTVPVATPAKSPRRHRAAPTIASATTPAVVADDDYVFDYTGRRR